ncbi:hypothetical protein [Geobacter sp.]|uniref:hypothetical protein n=1 Tax=Geobacter sp. TaxID=46610 RepID=UPI00359F8662
MSIRTNLMNRVKLALILAVGLAAVSSPTEAQDSPAGQGKDYLAVEAREMPPESRELIQIFASSIRHRDVKVTAGKGGSRLLTFTSDSILNGRAVRKFNQGLLERGINVYGAAYYGDFAWDRTIVDAAITITRPATGAPDTIEISEGIARDPLTNLPLMPLTVSINELTIPLKEDFGKAWKRLEIIPAVEPIAPEPKTGRYPGSKVRIVRQNDGERRQVIYAVKGDLRAVEQFFDAKLKEIHRTVIVAGDADSAASPAEVFGIKTSAQVIVLSGYSYNDKKLAYTEATLRHASDPNLSPYVEIEVAEN